MPLPRRKIYMRDISCEKITNVVKDLFLRATNAPDAGVMRLLQEAEERENLPHAREILRQLCENNRIAVAENTPACQDTGLAVVFLDIGQDAHVTGGELYAAVNEGVRRAYADGYLRKSVLDPLTRINTKDNTPAVIHTRIVPGENICITAAPKGFGSENMSRVAMLKPSDGAAGIAEFLVESAKLAGGSPCPPVVLGAAVGGTFESCALLAKRQLLRPVGQPAADETLHRMEAEVLERINALGMGPMGLGGKTYCLAVHIAKEPTHIAGLPVAVNFCCHMLRHAACTL